MEDEREGNVKQRQCRKYMLVTLSLSEDCCKATNTCIHVDTLLLCTWWHISIIYTSSATCMDSRDCSSHSWPSGDDVMVSVHIHVHVPTCMWFPRCMHCPPASSSLTPSLLPRSHSPPPSLSLWLYRGHEAAGQDHWRHKCSWQEVGEDCFPGQHQDRRPPLLACIWRGVCVCVHMRVYSATCIKFTVLSTTVSYTIPCDPNLLYSSTMPKSRMVHVHVCWQYYS